MQMNRSPPPEKARSFRRLRRLGSAVPDAWRILLSTPAFATLVSLLPEEIRGELQALREHLLDDLRHVSSWPVRKGVLRDEQARMVGVFLGELQTGGALFGVNLFKGSITGGSLTACNAALADLESGEIRAANLLAGSVRGGRVHAVNLLCCDVFGGEIERCGVLIGNVFGGRVQVGLLVGDIMGGEVEAVRHIGSRFTP
jgi:hypothetical protein